MNTFIKRTLLITLVIYSILIVTVYFIYSIYSYDFSVRQTYNLASNNHELYDESFNERLNLDYNNFVNYTNKYTDLNSLNNNLDELRLPHLNYLKVYQIDQDGLRDSTNLYDYLNYQDYQDLYDLDITFYSLDDVFLIDNNKQVGIFKKDNILITYEIESYLTKVNNTYNTIIMRDDGVIYYSYLKLANNTNTLSKYLSSNTTSYFHDYFSVGKNGAKWVEINNKEYIMVFSTLSENTPLYFITFYNPNDLKLAFDSLNLYVLGSLVIISLLFVISNILVFYLVTLKFTDIENAKYRFYFNQRLVLKINKKGKITFKNRAFIKNILNHKNYKQASDLVITDTHNEESVFESITKYESFTTNLETHDGILYTNFISIKMGRSYLLISDSLKGKELVSKEYERLALINTVTNLPNYNFLMKDLDSLTNNNKFSENNYVLLAFNIIDFKNINRLTGINISDEILNDLANIIKKSFNKYKFTIYNTYIDHFLLLIENVNDLDKLKETILSFINISETTGTLLKTKINLNIKAGLYEIKTIMGEEINSKQIYDRVISALNAAKNSSDLKLVTYDLALRDLLINKERLETELIESIEKGEFTLFLQPQYNLETKKIVAFESLIRWTNEKHKDISPQEFIRIAEENNLIDFIGKKTIEEAITIVKRLEKDDVKIAINVSPFQILKQGFVYQFESLIKKHNVKPNLIAIEITETVLATSLDLISVKLRSLQKLGIEIHIDDFGTGYSSLLYLKELPVNLIKIDKQFIDKITTDNYSKAIVNMIVNLSKNLGIKVIAEGVETKAQAKELEKLGVNLIQGYLISKAVSFTDAENLLNKELEK